MEIKREKPKTTTAWGTWEELLLASAVKRHGSKNWDSVALELQTRTILPATALACKQKYLDLRRRFTAGGGGNGDPDAIPWLDDLRKLRVTELRQEVQRYDVSILSLQSKVKRLEEERERSAEPNGNGLESPDLEDSEKKLSENDKKQPGKQERDNAGRSVSGDGTDRENRSVNESNSSGAKCQNPDETGDGERTPTGSGKPDPALSESKAAVTEDSYNGSSEPNQRRKGDDWVGQSKESSDVQSSASLTRKMNGWRKEVSGGSSGEEMAEDSRGIERIAVKSRALVGLLEAIRTHKQSSLFERRLESQENDKYKNTVRQHVDLESIQKRVDQGSYSSCSLRFYRDLMLLFNNAIVFFPKSSSESVSARQLRDIVSHHMHNQAQTPDPPPDSLSPPLLERSDSLLAKHKSSAPIIVCRKRSSISAKPMNFGLKAEAKSEEKKQVVDPKPPATNKDKPVTGTRTMRRGVKNQAPNGATNKKQNGSPVSAKKAEVLASEKKKSAADFLKRIERNSPVESPPKKKNQSTGKARKERVVKQGGAKEESSPSKRGVGRPPKKAAEAAPAKRARGEAAGKEASASKRPKKRAKR